MRLARYAVPGGEPALGVISDDRIISLEAAIPNRLGDMRTLIARWPELKPLVEEAAAAAAKATPLTSVTLLVPIERPRKISRSASTLPITSKNRRWRLRRSRCGSPMRRQQSTDPAARSKSRRNLPLWTLKRNWLRSSAQVAGRQARWLRLQGNRQRLTQMCRAGDARLFPETAPGPRPIATWLGKHQVFSGAGPLPRLHRLDWHEPCARVLHSRTSAGYKMFEWISGNRTDSLLRTRLQPSTKSSRPTRRTRPCFPMVPGDLGVGAAYSFER
jgi:hypothetical protein